MMAAHRVSDPNPEALGICAHNEIVPHWWKAANPGRVEPSVGSSTTRTLRWVPVTICAELLPAVRGDTATAFSACLALAVRLSVSP
jgi:hypothetical protein